MVSSISYSVSLTLATTSLSPPKAPFFALGRMSVVAASANEAAGEIAGLLYAGTRSKPHLESGDEAWLQNVGF